MSFRLGKAVDPERLFLTTHSRLHGRWDPNYYRHMTRFRARVKTCPFPVESLSRHLTQVQYGISERATSEAVGTPMLRMVNLQDDVWDLSELKYIQMPVEEKELYRLRAGDILFNRTNSKELVGKCQVFDLPGDYVFASYLIRVRTNEAKLLPDYVTAYLSLPIGRTLIDAVSRQIAGMTNINAQEIRELLVPRPDLPTQTRIVAAWKKALAQREQTEAQARQILAGIDDLLLAELGIKLPPEPPQALKTRIFRRNFSEVSGQRLDPAFHNPRFERLLSAIHKAPAARLGRMARRENEIWDRDTMFTGNFPYIEISCLDRDFGSLGAIPQIPSGEAPSRAQLVVREKDLLVSLTRPTRRAITMIEEHESPAIASTGFAVFRHFDANTIYPRFLFHVLRSKLCVLQMEQRSSGGNYPAITEDQLEKIVIPSPELTRQKEIASVLDSQMAGARRQMTAAATQLATAKQEIELMILGTKPV